MWSEVLLFAATAVCVITDVRQRKIYNNVIFPCMGAGVVGHAVADGWAGLGFSITGLLAGLGILLIPYLLGGIGAGDVKLLALIGSLQGWKFAVSAALFMGIAGGLMAIVYMVARKESRAYLFHLGYALLARLGRSRMPMPEGAGLLRSAMPYGVAIAAGAVMAWMWRGVLM